MRNGPRRAVLAPALVLTLLAAGCAAPSAGRDYMPLEPGNSWDYRVTTAAGRKSSRRLEITGRVSELTCRAADGGRPSLWSWEDGFLSVQQEGQRIYMLVLPVHEGASWWTVTPEGVRVWCRVTGFVPVSVPAGTFPRCAEVVMQPKGGKTEIRHWFARGVGWVKYSYGPTGGRPWMVRELTGYRVKTGGASR
ncbi:MAG: hypothetical protein ACYTGB_13235 [Planctomycetota bacterium]|jgi:hypothetical protein